MLRKSLKWLAAILASLALFLVLFYAEEDWRGARDWAACQKELQAKGEILDLRQLVPPGKPEDDLSKVPIFAEESQKYTPGYKGFPLKPTRLGRVDVHLGANEYKNKYPQNVSYRKGQSIDLIAWQKFYRALPQANLPAEVGTPAQDVLHALSQFDPEMNEVVAAMDNPNSYWPIGYNWPFDITAEGPMSMLQIAKGLPLRAVAHLDNHEIDLAERDYLLSFRLNQSLAKGCLMIDYLVMVVIRTTDDAILWEGLHRHAWNDAQLHEMDSALASTDMLALGIDCLRIERAFSLQVSLFIQQGGAAKLRQAAGVGDYDKYGFYDAIRLLSHRPSGMWDQDNCFKARELQERIEAIHPSLGTMDSQSFDYNKDLAQRRSWKIWYAYLSVVTLTAVDEFGEKIAHAETSRRLARLACRLEEYRIAHGQYPEKLDGLPDLPPHLNQEVLREQPLRYQRKGDGYLLYSVGWNQKDEGGLYSTDEKEGDWVWPSP